MSANKTVWEWQGKDELTKILKGIDEQIVKIDKDTQRMERDMDKAMKGSGRSVDYLRDKMRKLEDARNASFNPDLVRRFNREIQNTEREISRLQRIGTGGSMSNLTGNIPLGNTLMAGMGNPYVLAGMAAAASGKMIGDSVRYSRNMNTDMAKINATAQITPEALMGLRTSFFSTANAYSMDVNQLPAAYESILSATGDKAMADRIFKPALKLGKAGFTDAKTTGLALSQLMMTPGVNMTAEQIADMLMASKNYGKGELGDFARYLPGLIGTGKMRGFSEQDVSGAYAYLTRSNSSEQADMLLKNFLNVILRKDVTDNIRKQTGFNVFDGKGNIKDLQTIVKSISDAMKGMSDAARQTFLDNIKLVDQQAALAFSNLTSGADQLGEAINTMNNSAGTLNKTLKYVSDGNEALVQFSNNWSSLKDNLGKLFLPAANSVLSGANILIEGNWNWSDLFSSSFGADALYNKMLNESKGNKSQDLLESYKQNNLKQFFDPDSVDESAGRAISDIRKMFGKNLSDTQYINIHKQIKEYYNSLLGKDNLKNDTITDTNAERLNTATNNRSVRNVTVNIDTLMKVEKMATGTTEGKSVENTLDEILNGLVKVIRDSEQAVETY